MLTPDERAFAQHKYSADRAHELDLDKAVTAYEHGYFKGLFAINGGSAAAYLALQAKDGRFVTTHAGSVVLALGCWSFGFVFAFIAGWTAYEAQKVYVDALRSRRHALGLKIFGRHDSAVLAINAVDDVDGLMATAAERQSNGDGMWNAAHGIGLISAALFVLGGVFAVRALLP